MAFDYDSPAELFMPKHKGIRRRFAASSLLRLLGHLAEATFGAACQAGPAALSPAT